MTFEALNQNSLRKVRLRALPVWNVLVCCWIPVFFCQPVIDDVNLVRSSSKTHEEVIRLDITMQETLRVKVLDSINLPEETALHTS